MHGGCGVVRGRRAARGAIYLGGSGGTLAAHRCRCLHRCGLADLVRRGGVLLAHNGHLGDGRGGVGGVGERGDGHLFDVVWVCLARESGVQNPCRLLPLVFCSGMAFDANFQTRRSRVWHGDAHPARYGANVRQCYRSDSCRPSLVCVTVSVWRVRHEPTPSGRGLFARSTDNTAWE